MQAARSPGCKDLNNVKEIVEKGMLDYTKVKKC
jgi:hypothetical protein